MEVTEIDSSYTLQFKILSLKIHLIVNKSP